MTRMKRTLAMVAMMANLVLAFWGSAQAVTLNVQEWEGYISPYVKDFEAHAKAQGMDVTVVIVEPFIANPDQIFEAVRAQKVDVTTPTHNYYKMSDERLIKALLPIDPSRLTHYPDLLASLRAATYDESGGRKYSVPLLGGSYALAVNENLVSTPVDSWAALWDPANKGAFAITEDQFEANIYLCMLMAGYPPQSFYDVDATDFDEAKVQDWLNRLVANAGHFWGGMAQPKDIKPLKFTTTYWFGVALANKEGQRWKIVDPKEGQTVWLDTMALASHLEQDPEKLKAAYMLLDFMISPAIQKRIHEDYGSMIVNAKAPSLLDPAVVAAKRLGDEGFWKEEWFWKPLTARTRNLYKRMWTTAMTAAGR